MALGGRRFIFINNNQMADGVDIKWCVGEEARLGRDVWGGRLPVVWGVKLSDKKIERWADPWLALDGRHLMGGGGTKQPTKS